MNNTTTGTTRTLKNGYITLWKNTETSSMTLTAGGTREPGNPNSQTVANNFLIAL
jgi:hypothetical protein